MGVWCVSCGWGGVSGAAGFQTYALMADWDCHAGCQLSHALQVPQQGMVWRAGWCSGGCVQCHLHHDIQSGRAAHENVCLVVFTPLVIMQIYGVVVEKLNNFGGWHRTASPSNANPPSFPSPPSLSVWQKTG